ncbi:hypothetical protein [Phenylobacterium aquaticum]|uniref:hypothetical protein n=1 Tax=Phenylobacterium aquaticum TaxID=1763816 RepID=UPI0026EB82BD|nr:hypothetical protein [Phenylobacterium aquaticum]
MNDPKDATGLALWRDPGEDPSRLLGRMAAHPAFPNAARTLARAMLELGETDRDLDSLFKDAGRYAATLWALYLHAGDDLTLPRLKVICARTGLLSPGRARALLQLLEHLGFVERQPAAPGGVVPYRATPRFLAAWRAHLYAALAAAARVEPDAVRVLDRFADPGVLRLFLRHHAEGLLAALEGDRHGEASAEAPVFQVFFHPYAGSQILWTLMTQGEGEAFPPVRAGPLSVSALSRRFGVSRIHINRIFQEAARAGLAELGADGVVTLTGPARDQLRRIYATQLIQLLAAAARTAEQLDMAAPT